MRLVDAGEVKSKNEVYAIIEQPMYVYHSTEELLANVQNPNIVGSFDEFLALCRKNDINLEYYGLTTSARYKDITHLNVWLKTVDTFVPDYADLAGDIHYVVNEQGFISTDACYIRCYYIFPTSTKLVLLCSSGINSITITKWKITGAVRTQFLYEFDSRKARGNEETYNRSLNRMLNSVKPRVEMYKFFLAFLNPLSTSFMDLDKSAAATFGAKIRKSDRVKILQSPQFARAMMQVLKILMPELTAEAKKQFPPEKVIQLLADAAGFAKDNKNVKEILEVFDKISEIGYKANQVTTDNTLPPVPLIGHNQNELNVGNVNQLSEPTLQDAEHFFDNLREETGSMNAYVTLDSEEDELNNKEQ